MDLTCSEKGFGLLCMSEFQQHPEPNGARMVPEPGSGTTRAPRDGARIGPFHVVRGRPKGVPNDFGFVWETLPFFNENGGSGTTKVTPKRYPRDTALKGSGHHPKSSGTTGSVRAPHGSRMARGVQNEREAPGWRGAGRMTDLPGVKSEREQDYTSIIELL